MTPPFEDFLKTVRPISDGIAQLDPERDAGIREAASQLVALETIDRDSLRELVRGDKGVVAALGLVVGLSQERLKRLAKYYFGTESFAKVARESPAELIDQLDREFGLIAILVAERSRTFTFADILIARAAGHTRATSAQGGGRGVEDAIEEVIRGLRLPCQVRTRFQGRSGRTAPCDAAIPAGGAEAVIVVAAKGFDSTGSKLTDAVREVQEMADSRLPSQYVFAVIDGMGWHGRLSDLRKLHELAADRSIDGIYTRALLDAFSADVDAAAMRLGLARTPG
jgi:hypothetical protein